MRRAFTLFNAAATGVVTTIAIGALALPIQRAAAGENHGTWEQQMACTPDVFRLCGGEIPDEDRIVSCLRQNAAQLSTGCRAVFEANDSVPPKVSTSSVASSSGRANRQLH